MGANILKSGNGKRTRLVPGECSRDTCLIRGKLLLKILAHVTDTGNVEMKDRRSSLYKRVFNGVRLGIRTQNYLCKWGAVSHCDLSSFTCALEDRGETSGWNVAAAQSETVKGGGRERYTEGARVSRQGNAGGNNVEMWKACAKRGTTLEMGEEKETSYFLFSWKIYSSSRMLLYSSHHP